MDAIKAQLARIQQQLAGLTATQRMLAGSLVAIMVLTVVLWGRYASSSETVPVLDQPFDASMIMEALHTLKAEGINAAISGDRINVPADQVDHALATLGYSRMLPENTSHAFEDVLKQTNPFDGDEKSKLIFNHAREMQLAQIISGFPGVASAQVVINSTLDRHIGDKPVMPSGTVVMRTRSSADVNHLVDSSAFLLIRTVAGMQSKDVSVIVDDKNHKPHDPEGGSGGFSDGELYERIESQENHYQQRIADTIGYANPLVAVTVDINTDNVTQNSITFDPKKSMQQSIREQSDTNTSTNGSSAGEPGVAPNVGMSVTPQASAPSNTTSSEKTETTYQNGMASMSEVRVKTPGAVTVTAACVNLPRSAFLPDYKIKHPGEADPDEITLETFAKPSLEGVRHLVGLTCGMATDERVAVHIYSDSSSQVAIAGLGGTVTAGGAMSITSHLKEIAIGVLALASLFMVSMIVRKNPPLGANAAFAGVGGMAGPISNFLDVRSAAGVEDDGTPIVGGGRQAMEGVELDDDAYKAQQMVEQVTSMVQENPDAAATLVKRWLSKA